MRFNTLYLATDGEYELLYPKIIFFLVGALASTSPLMASERMLREQVQSEAMAVFAPLPNVETVLDELGYSSDMVDLGRHLFFDNRVSLGQDISCASCHAFDAGGSDARKTSIGHKGALGGRNAPTVLNAVFNIEQFWDGRANDLAEQAKGPVENPIEMANHRDNLIQTLAEIPGYVERFSAAFPDANNPITFDNFAHAIAAFEATLITPTRFDEFLLGRQEALELDEIVGLRIFLDTGCMECHNGLNLGGNNYQYFGAVKDPSEKYMPRDDLGVAAVTGDPSDKYLFRVPSLRNVALSGPYFHSGAASTLTEAVQVMANVQLGARLDDQDVDLIIAFLETLSGVPERITAPVPLQKPQPVPEIAIDPETAQNATLAAREPAG